MIVFVFINAIDSVDIIDCRNLINPDVLNCSVLQLNDNTNDPTKTGMTFWGKKGEPFEVTGIYCNLRILHDFCSRKKENSLRVNS